MKVLFLIVNTVCDLACRDCFYTRGYEKRTPERIKKEDAGLFATKIADNGFTTVILTGGDPLMSKFKDDTYALIDALKRLKLKVIINTSAAKLTAKDIETLAKLKVDRVDISINSHIREIHNLERGCFDETIWALKEMLRAKIPVSTTTVITELNAKDAADTLKQLQNLGVEDVRYQPLFVENCKQNYDVIGNGMLECAKVSHNTHTVCYLQQCLKAYTDGRLLVSARCQMGRKYFVCDSAGDLFPCFHRVQDCFGNILTDSCETITEKLQSSAYFNGWNRGCFGKHCVSLFDNPNFWRW